MKGRTEPSQRQRKPDDVDVTAVTGSMAPSTAPFVAKSPPPPAPPPTGTGTTGSHVSLTNSLHGTSSLLAATSNRHKHLDTEVTSAVSSMASSAKTPPRSNPDAGKTPSPAWEETTYLFFGCVQGIIGIVMAVFGVMALMRDASMATTGAGVWGGAVGLASGTIGMVAGLRSCYARSIERQSIAPTAFMASSLVSIATANLVLVLTSIGLARDFRNLRPEQVIEDESENAAWRGVLALCGLVLASALQLLASIASAYRCYRVVCPCASRRHEPLYNQSCAGSPDSLRSTLKSNTKDRLVSHWLTGASDAPSTTLSAAAATPMFPGSPTPSGLLLFSTQPPPPGHHPQTVYSLPPLPPPQGIPLPMRYPQYPMMIQARPRPRVMRSAVPPSRLSPVPVTSHRRRHHQGHGSHDRRRQRRERDQRNKTNSGRTSPITAAQVAKTYTGLDRKMAEDFLTVMDHGRHNTGGRSASSSYSKPQERVPVKAASTPSPGSAPSDDF